MEEYGRTLVSPGAGWAELLEVTEIRDADPPSLHIAAPLWTREEGRSDLTLEVRLTPRSPRDYDVEVDDLHVL